VDLHGSAALLRVHTRPFVSAVSHLGRSLATAPHRAGGLLVVGTPEFEPWHLVAHLRDAARWSGASMLAPDLVRHAVPPNAPPHLAVGLDRLERAGRGETVLVVTAGPAAAGLLERLADARRRGGTVLALTGGDDAELLGIAHDNAQVDADHEFEPAMHLVPMAAAGLLPRRRIIPARIGGR
jgi:hypothetical protein